MAEVAELENGAASLGSVGAACVGGEADVEAAALVEAVPSPLGSSPEALQAVSVALILPVK